MSMRLLEAICIEKSIASADFNAPLSNLISWGYPARREPARPMGLRLSAYAEWEREEWSKRVKLD